MIRLKATMDSRALTGFNKAMRSQVPYATACALTSVAKRAQAEIQKELPDRFVIRNTFTKSSIRIRRAEKKDWPNCTAEVGTISPYMPLQEEGGTKSPTGKAFSIPKGIRKSEKELVRRSKWPAKILDPNSRIPGGGRTKGARNGVRKTPKPFLLKEKSGVGVYVRVSKRGRAIKRLFRLTRSSVNVKARHWLEAPASRIVNAHLQDEFEKALVKALATKR